MTHVTDQYKALTKSQMIEEANNLRHSVTYVMNPRKQKMMMTLEQQIAQTWDLAYSLGFRCGEERGFALGWDAALLEVAAEEE